jgi:hypothetical protein
MAGWRSPRIVCVGSAVAAVLSLILGAASPALATQGKSARRPTPVRPCNPSDLTATLALTGLGNAPSTLAGAVLFSNSSTGACSLRGVPRVGVVSPSGQAITVAQAPMRLRLVTPVTLSTSSSSAAAGPAGSSITWSGWGCPIGSFALDVRFQGWDRSITVPYGTTTGYAGKPCTSGDATIYVGPVARAASPG